MYATAYKSVSAHFIYTNCWNQCYWARHIYINSLSLHFKSHRGCHWAIRDTHNKCRIKNSKHKFNTQYTHTHALDFYLCLCVISQWDKIELSIYRKFQSPGHCNMQAIKRGYRTIFRLKTTFTFNSFFLEKQRNGLIGGNGFFRVCNPSKLWRLTNFSKWIRKKVFRKLLQFEWNFNSKNIQTINMQIGEFRVVETLKFASVYFFLCGKKWTRYGYN